MNIIPEDLVLFSLGPQFGRKKKPFHLLFGNENIRLLNTDFTLILMAHIYPLGCDP